MSHIIQCNRCPVTIAHTDEAFGLEWAALTDANDNCSAGRDNDFHLCPDCVKAFDTWAST